MSRGVNGIRDLNSRQVQILSVTSMLIFLSTLAITKTSPVSTPPCVGLSSPFILYPQWTSTARVPPKTGSNVYPGLWTAIEASLGIVTACLPSLGPILHKVIGYPLPTTKDNSTAQSQHRSTHSIHPFRDAEVDGFERILEPSPPGRDEAVIMNAIVGRSSASSETESTGTSHVIQKLRRRRQ